MVKLCRQLDCESLSSTLLAYSSQNESRCLALPSKERVAMDQRQHAQPSLRPQWNGIATDDIPKTAHHLGSNCHIVYHHSDTGSYSCNLVKDIYPWIGDSYPGGLKNVNGTLFFGALDENGRVYGKPMAHRTVPSRSTMELHSEIYGL
jgi:hypothetical protein